MMRHAFIICLLALSLTACGKRADVVEAPEGTNPNAYPRHYPDISTDPAGSYTLPQNLQK